MRIFSTECGWVEEDQRFIEIYFIDGQEVSFEEYSYGMEMERRMFSERKTKELEIEPELEPELELSEEEKQDMEFVEQYAYDIENMQSLDSEQELRYILYDLLCTARDIGYAEAYEEIEEENEEENNIYTYSLTITPDKINIEDFINELKSLSRISLR